MDVTRSRVVGSDHQLALGKLDVVQSKFDSLLEAVAPGDWKRPTPCDEWNVGDLVDHVTGAGRIYAGLLSGLPFREAMNAGSADQAQAASRIESFRSAVTQLRVAFESPGALSKVCAVPGGTVTGADLVTVRIFDVAVHYWDLARGIGVPETLPDAIVAHAWGYAVAHSGEGRPNDTTATMNGLIRLTGRTP